MNIELNKILAWDIETIPMQGFSEDSPFFDTWQNRKRKEDLSSQELIDLFNTEGGLYGEYLQIVCLSCAFIHEGEIRIKSLTGTEKEIIDEFLKVAEFVNNRSGGVINVGHNIQNYDIPVLRKVFSRYYPMFSLPDYISDISTKGKLPVPEKPWVLSERILDTLQIQKGGNYMFSSMAEVALNLGLPSPKLDTNGSKVAEMYANKEFDRITRYCEGDVLTSMKILFSWMGLSFLPVAESIEKVEPKKLTVLEKISSDNDFTPEMQEEVKKLIGKKKLTKKDKLNLKTILEAVWFKDDFINRNQDSKKDREHKEFEIEEFIKNLKR